MTALLAMRYHVLIVIVVALAGCGEQPTQAPVVRSVDAEATGMRTARGDILFVQGYNEGYRLAMAAGKPMLVFFTAEWCTYCHQMAEDAFRQPDIVTLSNRFVCILVDADAEPGVCRQFQVGGYPTVQFISPRGVPLGRLVGRQPAGRLVPEMRSALEASAREVDPAGETAHRWRRSPAALRRGADTATDTAQPGGVRKL